MTVTAVSPLIGGFADVPSVCQLCVAVSGELIPPLDPDCNIML